MSGKPLAVVIPIYNKFIYARRAILSLFKHGPPEAMALIVDDASPDPVDWDRWWEGDGRPEDRIPRDRCVFQRFDRNLGLTAGWNWGLAEARRLRAEYAVCTNSDILFTPHWHQALLHQADKGEYRLLGPVSNAPGIETSWRQKVKNYYTKYQVSDEAQDIAEVSKTLWKAYGSDTVVGDAKMAINGFFMLAKTEIWWAGRYSEDHVFNPAKKMKGNEDELQRRWKLKSYRSGICPGSFIFHYRSVSRGRAFATEGWHRLQDPAKPI